MFRRSCGGTVPTSRARAVVLATTGAHPPAITKEKGAYEFDSVAFGFEAQTCDGRAGNFWLLNFTLRFSSAQPFRRRRLDSVLTLQLGWARLCSGCCSVRGDHSVRALAEWAVRVGWGARDSVPVVVHFGGAALRALAD